MNMKTPRTASESQDRVSMHKQKWRRAVYGTCLINKVADQFGGRFGVWYELLLYIYAINWLTVTKVLITSFEA